MATPIDNLFLPRTTETFYNPSQVRNFRGPFDKKIVVGSLSDGVLADISRYVTAANVNYSISMESQLEFSVVDIDFKMAKNNYFILGRDVVYETQTLGKVNSQTGEVRQVRQLFEIANVTVSQGQGGNAMYTIKCYTKAIQQMKRDKQPQTIKGNGTTFIRNAALKYGLEFFGEQTTKGKRTSKPAGSKQAESVWTVMDRIATDNKFVLFEVDGVLIFASEKFLMHKWGTEIRFIKRKDKKTKKVRTLSRRYIPLQFPNAGPDYKGRSGLFRLTEHPTITKSQNDPYYADGSCTVERFSGTQIRPGMTAYVGIVPDMSNYYLITDVSFNEMTPDPVSITFRSLTRDTEKDDIKLLPVGQTFQQTNVDGQIRTVESARLESGQKISTSKPDSRITGANMPTAASPYVYPKMKYANISTTYAAFFPGLSASTNNLNTVLITGNIDLWNRPVLPILNKRGKTVELRTLYTITYIVAAGSEYRGILLPLIFTEGGAAVEKTEAQVISKYNADGGYSAGAKFLAVVAGATKRAALLNARDYALLLSKQQELIVRQRFSGINLGNIPNTPGSADSGW